jgi:hypothetical protein
MGVQQKTLMSREKIMQAMWVAARALQWKKQPVVGAPQQPMQREGETAAIAAAAPTLSSMHAGAHARREDAPGAGAHAGVRSFRTALVRTPRFALLALKAWERRLRCATRQSVRAA